MKKYFSDVESTSITRQYFFHFQVLIQQQILLNKHTLMIVIAVLYIWDQYPVVHLLGIVIIAIYICPANNIDYHRAQI